MKEGRTVLTRKVWGWGGRHSRGSPLIHGQVREYKLTGNRTRLYTSRPAHLLTPQKPTSSIEALFQTKCSVITQNSHSATSCGSSIQQSQSMQDLSHPKQPSGFLRAVGFYVVLTLLLYKCVQNILPPFSLPIPLPHLFSVSLSLSSSVIMHTYRHPATHTLQRHGEEQ